MIRSKTAQRPMFAVCIAFALVASLSLRSRALADAGTVEADALSRKELAESVEPFYRIWSGKEDRFALRVNGSVQIKGTPQAIQLDVAKFDDQSFDFVAVHPEYAVSVHRRQEMTAMVLPKHKKVFVGNGRVEGADTLVPRGISTRLAGNASQIGPFVQMLGQGDAASLISLASSLIKIEQIDGEESWRLGGTVKIWFDKTDVDVRMHVAVDSHELTVSLLDELIPASPATWSDLEQVAIDRSEMEEQFSRGIRRAWEVVWPSHELTIPKSLSKKTAHGELKYVEGQRLVVLAGTPEQIGTAHGEGQWDGVPMATLMRRALEECSTLQQVTDLWTKSPRTCEYYYVFADGKTNDAVGVAATPEKLELIGPGQADARLGEGIQDAVVLSAGSRLETLRARVIENHGKIDTEKALWLMSRPVAMSSNLHNVLFIPADRVFYVANADHHNPAADRPYVKFDLNALLGGSGLISAANAAAKEAVVPNRVPLSVR